MYEILDAPRPGLVALRVSGTLSKDDYGALVPWLESEIAHHETIRVLVILDGFEGWRSFGAGWEDLKMDVRLAPHVERLAMVGYKGWEEWMTKLSDPFFSTRMRWFEAGRLADAWHWVDEETSLPDC